MLALVAVAQAGIALTLRGAVVSETGERVPYAVVVLEPGYSRRFTDENGIFALAGVAPGTYQLRVRQVGYSPFDSSITVTAGTPQLRIELRHVAVRMADLTVSARGACRVATPPDSGTALQAIFEQLRQNAERYRLLQDRYPFIAAMSRTFTRTRVDVPPSIMRDTIRLESWAHWQYAPRQVVIPDTEATQPGTKLVRIVTLENLADSAFWAWHCFNFAGLDTALDHSWIRIDFRAAAALRDPDVNGSAYLDPDSYKLGLVRMDLTHVERAVSGVDRWVATTTFREFGPSVLVPATVRSVTTNSRHLGFGAISEVIEEQKLLAVTFVRAPATGRDSTP